MDHVELLCLKKNLLYDMLVSTEKMCDLIGKDKFEQLGEEAVRREEIIVQINQADEGLKHFSDVNESSEEVHILISGIQMLLRDIFTLNQRNNDTLIIKQKEYTSQIKNVKQSKKGINGYVAPFTTQHSIFIDAKK